MDYLQYIIRPFITDADDMVLNLIINGLPSILYARLMDVLTGYSFKPYYKWITFNITT